MSEQRSVCPSVEHSIEALRNGDEVAWELFFAEYDGLIASVVAWPKWHFRPHIRDELAQQIRSELPRSVARTDGDVTLAHLVKRVCIRRCIDQVRREVRRRGTLISLTHTDRDGSERERDIKDTGFDPVQAIVAQERASAVRALVDSLDRTCRQAIESFYMHERTYKEMAAELGISVNTVGSRLSKCLEKLRKSIETSAPLKEDLIASCD